LIIVFYRDYASGKGTKKKHVTKSHGQKGTICMVYYKSFLKFEEINLMFPKSNADVPLQNSAGNALKKLAEQNRVKMFSL